MENDKSRNFRIHILFDDTFHIRKKSRFEKKVSHINLVVAAERFKAGVDRCNWASIEKTNPRLLCISLRIFSVHRLMQNGLWSDASRCNEVQNCVDGDAKLPCCRAKRHIERDIETYRADNAVGFVAFAR